MEICNAEDIRCIVLGRLDIYALVRLHACVSKWLRDSGWITGLVAALSPAQKQILCDRTPFTFKKHLNTALTEGPAWLVEAFVTELKAKQARFDVADEKTLRQHHEAIPKLRKLIGAKRARLEKFEDTLQEKLAKVREAMSATRDHDERELKRATLELAEHERALP